MSNSNKEVAAQALIDEVHAGIAREAATLREAIEVGVCGAEKFPALEQLFGSATAAIEDSIPATFEHEGKTYFLRASMGAIRLMIFDSPDSYKPMAMAISSSLSEYGHEPGC